MIRHPVFRAVSMSGQRLASACLAGFFLFLHLAGSPLAAQARTEEAAQRLIHAARAQIGVTRSYDGAYTRIAYPGGDVDPTTGVCTDVLIRAYRQAFRHDMQRAVHEDMQRSFAVYPKTWGLRRPDANIDHRRVPNLQTFFTRKGARLGADAELRPGDLVTQMIAGRLPHVAIVSDRKSADRARYLLLHNIGAGVQEEDALLAYPITGHYRYLPPFP
jgi:uncharacterized protein YijF (DUF1287 family)